MGKTRRSTPPPGPGCGKCPSAGLYRSEAAAEMILAAHPGLLLCFTLRLRTGSSSRKPSEITQLAPQAALSEVP